VVATEDAVAGSRLITETRISKTQAIRRIFLCMEALSFRFWFWKNLPAQKGRGKARFTYRIRGNYSTAILKNQEFFIKLSCFSQEIILFYYYLTQK
jgi:hypothetical protein